MCSVSEQKEAARMLLLTSKDHRRNIRTSGQRRLIFSRVVLNVPSTTVCSSLGQWRIYASWLRRRTRCMPSPPAARVHLFKATTAAQHKSGSAWRREALTPNYISISHNEQRRPVRNVTLVLKEQRKHQKCNSNLNYSRTTMTLQQTGVILS